MDDEQKPPQCPKCDATSGDDWTQCGGSCPVRGSPHYDPEAFGLDAVPASPLRARILRHAMRSALTMFCVAVSIAMAWAAFMLPMKFLVAIAVVGIVVIAIVGIWLVMGQVLEEWLPPE